ncbi:LysM peptidoglycan-binding domain-containing protein [Ectothiorhodospiraceae bacterium BW-2]|nr:LysM peptidoglycan-binding domain-containing protein [Ectothiorhodospiraceae bacterium BW-2]
MKKNGLLAWGAVVVVSILCGCSGSQVRYEPPVTPSEAVSEPTSVELTPTPDSAVVKESAPQLYTVVSGDTLWDIASRFLTDPWRWPEVWQSNPQIENPHLIFPGDQLKLLMEGGRAVIRKVEGEQVRCVGYTEEGRCIERLSPQVRESSLKGAITTIPANVITPFLRQPRVMSPNSLDDAPYVLSSADEHLIAGTDNRIYARGIQSKMTSDYLVVRPGTIYRNPDDSDDILGQEALVAAEARLVRFGDPATLDIVDAEREVLNGDRLIPLVEQGHQNNYLPHSPPEGVRAQIMAVLDGDRLIGQYHVVALNIGREDQIESGHVLAAYDSGRQVRDFATGEWLKLPDERSGLLMVFRVFERMSYALVMEATLPMRIGDRIGAP